MQFNEKQTSITKLEFLSVTFIRKYYLPTEKLAIEGCNIKNGILKIKIIDLVKRGVTGWLAVICTTSRKSTIRETLRHGYP